MGALAAGLGMGLVGALTKPKQSNQTSTTTSQTTLAPWQEQYWQGQVSQAKQLADQPYQAYSGQRVADLTQPQQLGIQNTVNNADQWRTPINAAANTYGNVTQPFDGNSLNPYMSPYLNDVVSNIEREGNENFSAPGGVGDTIESDFTGLGQFGSKRMGDVMNRAGELNQRETQGAVSNALNTGFNQAENEYNAKNAQDLWAAQGLTGLGTATSNLNAGETNALLGVGGLEQQQNQAQLNVPYQNYLEGRDWQLNRAQAAKSLTAGMPTEGTNVSSTTAPGPYQTTPLQNVLGGIGLYNSGFFDNLMPGGDSSGGGGIPYVPVGGGTDYGMSMLAGEDPTAGGTFLSGAWKKGGRITKRGALSNVFDADGDDDNNRDVLRGGLTSGYAKGGFIKRAIKHPGALHRMMGVPQGQKIPAKRLHAAAEKGGVLGRRARFAEELEGFHHAKGGRVAYRTGGLNAGY